jgi:hypothetical protein
MQENCSPKNCLMRILLVPSFFFMVVYDTMAQSFSAGLLAGVSATQLSGDNLGGFDKPGLVAGGMVRMPVTDRWDMALEILYFQKGSRKNADPEKGDYTSYVCKLNYFEVPILFQYKTPKRFTFEAGPTFGALLYSYEEDEYGEIPDRRPFNSFELGVAGGMKVHFARDFSFVLRYGQSVMPVREHESGETYYFNKGQYNSSLLIAFQYVFRKKQAQ